MEPAEREPLLGSQASSTSQGTGPGPDLSAFQPLPESQKERHLTEWAEGQYVTNSQTQPSVPAEENAAWATGNEIRQAASEDPYPQWIYGALVNPEASSAPLSQAPAEQHAGGLQGEQLKAPGPPSAPAFQEEDIREILTDFVDRQRCWGGRPAHKWTIQKVEDCNVYLGTLETFIEEREVVKQVEPYVGGEVDDKTIGRSPGPWEVDMRTEFPLLFTPRKQSSLKLPHSEVVENCPDCFGRKEVPCPVCNKDQEPGSYLSGQTTVCPRCYGRGLLAHQDGSDSKCLQCEGKGRLPCAQCNSRGLLKCKKCQGSGALLLGNLLTVTWRTLVTKKISASSNAASVPDEVFHEGKGVQLYSSESYQCHPVCFPNCHGLTKLSSDIIADHAQVPPSARVICERQQMYMIPVTRVLVSQGDRSFKFYIVGLNKWIYVKDYPSRCCYGLCCCQSSCTIL